jgi:HD-GYP domain-containing protein (c-di-GMP phosphodiesterase class II)/DNA-binding CsgD family transcriptional regulator
LAEQRVRQVTLDQARSMSRQGGNDPGSAAGASACQALEAALRARMPRAQASTGMVRELVGRIARRLGLSDAEVVVGDLSARVRDIGMLALPDSVVFATGALTPVEWEHLNQHPVIGSELLSGIAVTESLAPVVRAHHERWDGEGYPDGLRGESIPVLSRIIAVCDAFVAIATDRPHRRGIGPEAALEHVTQQRATQFDPAAVEALAREITGIAPHSVHPRRAQPNAAARPAPSRGSLLRVIEELDVMPAFAPARERLLAATAEGAPPADGNVVSMIESDIGLTVAVLRQAQQSGRTITNVADAVGALDQPGLHDVAERCPAAAFPWRTSQEAAIHHLRVHAQAVVRAADRIAQHAEPDRRDDLIAAALLHDIGKLALSRSGRTELGDDAAVTPEHRAEQERRRFGLDHASLGGLLLDRWQLPRQLVSTVAAHHTADGEQTPATMLRLADAAAHLAQGHAVERRVILRLAAACRMDPRTLREVLFDLPHTGGSRRRRAQPSPLTQRETSVLRLLADGNVYKEIAAELNLSTSTVRSHLQNIYGKLEVSDRAQAVLTATERGWI